MRDDFTNAEVFEEMVKIVGMDIGEKFMPDHLKRGFAYYSQFKKFRQLNQYYETYHNQGFSKKVSLSGAVAATTSSSFFEKHSGSLVIYGAETVKSGLIVTVAGAAEGAQAGALAGGIAGGAAGIEGGPGGVAAGVWVGSRGGALLGGAIGAIPGLTLTAEGYLMMYLGAAGSLKAESMGGTVGLTVCRTLTTGEQLKPIMGAIKGFFLRKSFDSNEFLYETIERCIKGDKKATIFSGIKNDGNYTASEKAAILHEFDEQININNLLGNVLGTDITKIPPQGVGLLTYPENAWFLADEDPIILKKGNKQTTWKYNFPKYGIHVEPGSKEEKELEDYLLKKNGILKMDGQLNFQLIWEYFNDELAKSNKRMDAIEDRQEITDKKVDVLFDQFAKFIVLNQKQYETLKAYIMQGLIHKAEDGKEYSVPEMIASLYFDLENKKEAAQKQAKYSQRIGMARSVTALGTLIGSPEMERFGLITECIVQMGYSLLGVAVGDFTAIANFLSTCITLKQLFKKDKSIDPRQLILQQLHNIALQIEDLKITLIDIGLELKAQLESMLSQMKECFRQVYVEIYISRLLIMQKLDRLQSSVHHLSIQLDRQINGLWLQDLVEAQFNVHNYKMRAGELSSVKMDESNNYNKFEKITNTLVFWFNEKAGYPNSLGNHLYYRGCPPEKTLMVLQSAEPENILGFLIHTITGKKAYLCTDLQLNVVNPYIWLQAATTFMEVITGLNLKEFYWKYDPQGNVYKQLLISGTHVLNVFEKIRGESQVFISLLNDYAIGLEKLKPIFLSLVELKCLQNCSSVVKSSVDHDREEITTRQRIFDVQCGHNLKPHKNETNFAGVQRVLNHWNNVIAKEVVPDFFVYYKSKLYEELAIPGHFTLRRFHVMSNNFLLPLSILFQPNDELLNSLELPLEILLAEKSGKGDFVFDIPHLPTHTVGDIQKDHNNVILRTFSFDVRISFRHTQSNTTIDVATVTLNVDENAHHSAVFAIKNSMTIDCSHGAEACNPFYEKARDTLNVVVPISAWLNAKVTKYELTLDYTSEVMSVIMTELNTISNVYINGIANEIKNRQAEILNHDEAKEYVNQFEAFLTCLDELDVTYELLSTFARIAGFPEELHQKIKKLWNSEHVKELIACFSPSNIQNLTIDNREKNRQRTTFKNIFKALQLFEEWIETHLYEENEETVSLPMARVAYKNVVQYVQDHLTQAMKKPYLSENPLQMGILNLLKEMISKDTLGKLSLTFEDAWIEENLPWQQSYDLVVVEKAKQKISTPPLEYTHDVIEKILVYRHEIKENQFSTRVLPTYKPSEKLFSALYNEIFEKNISATLREHMTGVRIIQPLALPIRAYPDHLLWVLNIIIYDSLRKEAVVLFLHPSDINKKVERVDITPTNNKISNLAKVDSRELQKIISMVFRAIQRTKIPIKKSSVFFLSQCNHVHDLKSYSGIYLLDNIYRFMTQEPFSKSLSEDELKNKSRGEHPKLLQKIDQEYPCLLAKPANFDLKLLPSGDNSSVSKLSSSYKPEKGSSKSKFHSSASTRSKPAPALPPPKDNGQASSSQKGKERVYG